MEVFVQALEALAGLSQDDYNAVLPSLQSAINSPSEANIEAVSNVIADLNSEVDEE